MIEKLTNILNKKHLLIVGGTKEERKKIINQLIMEANYETYRFPSNMKTLCDYLKYVEKQNLYDAWYQQKGKFETNQLLDFHWDWMHQNNALIVLEEFQLMEEVWKIELIRIFLEKIENHKKDEPFIHLIASQEKESNIIEKLTKKIFISKKENRTKRQIAEGSLKVINIDFLK